MEANSKWAVGLFVTPEGPESLVVSGGASVVALVTLRGAENSEVLLEEF